MKILFFGGTGLISSACSDLAIARGNELTILNRSVSTQYPLPAGARSLVGDVHGDIKLIAVAWAEGIQAAIHTFKEITSPYWLNEKRLQDHKIALIGEKIARAASKISTREAQRTPSA